MFYYYCGVLLFCYVSLVNCVTVKIASDINYSSFVSKLNKVNNKPLLFDNPKLFLPKSESLYKGIKAAEGYDDKICSDQITAFQNGLNNTEMWALNMFDSSGKIPSGIFYGNSYEFGNFDQCLEVEYNTNSVGIINGQYCLNKIKMINESDSPISKIALSIGLCVPAKCSPTFIKQSLNQILGQVGLVSEITPPLCVTNETKKWEIVDWIAIVFFTIIAVLMVCSTLYDLGMRHYEKAPIPILLSFSMYTNGQKIFSCKKSNSPDVLHCLNGIRVLSIVWIVLGHTYTMSTSTSINMISLTTWIENAHSMLLLSGTVSVDSFLLLSGLLVTWSIFKELKKNGSINVPLMYFHRYLRIVPAMAALVLFSASLIRYSGSGPIWHNTIDSSVKFCSANWWSSLLFVQNYVNPEEICLGHTWYLSVDMQLFILSPLIIYPLWKWGKIFVWAVVVLILLSIGCVFATFYTNDFTLRIITGGGISNMEKMKKIYFATHSRCGVWLIGVILAYLIQVAREKRFKISKVWIIIGWIISFGTILAVIFGQYSIQQPDYKENLIENAFYDSFSRIAWGVALSWIIFACVQGYGGPINWFLSLAFWIPIARLSYSIYLLHYVIQYMLIASVRTSSYFSDINELHIFWGDFGFSLTLAIFWSLAFESPITVLEKFLIKRKPASNSRKDDLIKDTLAPA